MDAVVKSFSAMVVRNYDKALLPKIIAQFKKLERTKAGRHEVVLTSARTLEKSVIADVKKKVGENSGITEVIDPKVLGGVRILINDEVVIDGTYRTRVRRMVEDVVRVNE